MSCFLVLCSITDQCEDRKPKSHGGGKDASESRSRIGSLLVTEKIKKPVMEVVKMPKSHEA